MRATSLILAVLAALALAGPPAAADPVVDELLPLIEDEDEGDHVVGEDMCARPAGGATTG